ncbi:MAG: hypothetical protein KC729_09285, partial [Candidatus Eisenbacteria bacterium]|nr:hypothetical protein [Candidatus Eisenbacteria bacterium]
MRNLPLRLALVLVVVLVGSTAVWRFVGTRLTERGQASVPSSSHLDEGSDWDAEVEGRAILQNLGVPRGPFSPVLAVPMDRERLLPAFNRRVNDPAGEAVGIVQSEVSIAVLGDKICVGWNDGQGFVDGSGVSGFGYSNDRGMTFVDGGDVPGSANVDVFGDP